jgi:hypothetical protein
MSQEQEDYKEAGERAQSNPSLRYAGRDHCPAACTGTRLVEKQRNVLFNQRPQEHRPSPQLSLHILAKASFTSPIPPRSNNQLTLQIHFQHEAHPPNPPPPRIPNSTACPGYFNIFLPRLTGLLTYISTLTRPKPHKTNITYFGGPSLSRFPSAFLVISALSLAVGRFK